MTQRTSNNPTNSNAQTDKSRTLKSATEKEIRKVGSIVCDLLEIMRRLRAPDGCPWDREQTHESIRLHAVEEVYEMIDAIEAGDDLELEEELGDLLLQVVFHSQLAEERGKFDFVKVVAAIRDKLIRRHPHVFEDVEVENVDAVWKQWEAIKREEKAGSHLERKSALDGIPKGLNGVMRAQKLLKKAIKAGLYQSELANTKPAEGEKITEGIIGRQLAHWVSIAQMEGINAESALRKEVDALERKWRQEERT